MTAAVVWKEYREHRAVWLALLLACAAVMYAASQSPARTGGGGVREILLFVSLLLTWAEGLVCGAALLAGEREAGTQAFLDQMPVMRGSVLRAKLLAAGLFVVAFIASVTGLAHWLGTTIDFPEFTVVAFAVFGLFGLSLGVGASAFARTGLGAVGLAILSLLVVTPLMLPTLVLPAALAFTILFGGPMPGPLPGVVIVLAWLVLPVPVAAYVYTLPDRDRLGPPAEPPTPPVAGHLAWLCGRQFVALWLLAPVIGLGLGVAVLAEGLFIFPPASLLMGVACGAWVFLDEQGGASRFWGEQRLPVAPLWWAKVGSGLLALTLGWVGLLAPSLGGAFTAHRGAWTEALSRLGSPLLGNLIPVWAYLTVWPVTGFAAGVFLSLVIRKPLAAFVAAVGLSSLLCAVWVPSMLTGGLPGWMPLLPALALLVFSRWMVRPWAAGDSAAGLAALAGVAAVALIAAGLAWRVYSIPATPEPEGFQAFLARLPAPEQNEGAALTRRALEGFPRGVPAAEQERYTQAMSVTREGWEVGDEALAAWLEGKCKGPWGKLLIEAAEKPTGVYFDPARTLLLGDETGWAVDAGHQAANLLVADALRRQAEKNEPEVFPAVLEAVLALSRTLENAAPSWHASGASGIDGPALTGLPHWLARLKGRPELIRRVAAALAKHAERLPPEDHELADYAAACNTLTLPEAALSVRAGEMAPWLVSSLELPWEAARLRRAIRQAALGTPEPNPLIDVGGQLYHRGERRLQLRWRAFRLDSARVMAALYQYRGAKGKAAATLSDLVPDYLPAVPEGLTYRISAGEEIPWPPNQPGAEARKILPGEAILEGRHGGFAVIVPNPAG